MPAGEQHLVVVHVVAESGAFVRRKGKFFQQKAHRVALIRALFAHVQPVSARKGQPQPCQERRQFLHTVVFGAFFVIDGDLAHRFVRGGLVQVALPVGDVGELHEAHERLRIFAVVRPFGGAEQGVRSGYVPHGVEYAHGFRRGQGVGVQNFAAAGDDRPVFGDIYDFIGNGSEQLAKSRQLPPARRAE